MNQETVANWESRTFAADLAWVPGCQNRASCRSRTRRSSSPFTGISRLSELEGDKPAKKRFKAYPIGYIHLDIAKVQAPEGKLYLHVAIDRASKFAVGQLVRKTGRTSASAFMDSVIEAIPYKIHTVLTDNGIQFTPRSATPTVQQLAI